MTSDARVTARRPQSGERLRVLSLVDLVKDSGGAERFAVALATHLPADRFESWMCSTRFSEPATIAQLEQQGVGHLAINRRGKLDREDGPAIIETHADGSRFEHYYRGGRRHRKDGPALILAGADGTRVEQYHRRGKLHREDGPAIIETRMSGSSTEKYYRDAELHRTNGPAIIETWADGTCAKHYYQHGKLHRARGPARIGRHGHKQWWLRGTIQPKS